MTVGPAQVSHSHNRSCVFTLGSTSSAITARAARDPSSLVRRRTRRPLVLVILGRVRRRRSSRLFRRRHGQRRRGLLRGEGKQEIRVERKLFVLPDAPDGEQRHLRQPGFEADVAQVRNDVSVGLETRRNDHTKT